MVGGFGVCGYNLLKFRIPESLIDALKETQVNNLTVVSNNAGKLII